MNITHLSQANLACPAVPELALSAEGVPYLQGSRCESCGQVYLGSRLTCARCFARNRMTSVRLAETGKLYSYTIVHRSYSGVRVPFVMAIVDLEDGCTLKGTLTDVSTEIGALTFDMPVRVVYRLTSQCDDAARPFISYYFVAAP